MDTIPLTPGELNRLNLLKSNSPQAEFDWVKARFKAINAELLKLKGRFDLGGE